MLQSAPANLLSANHRSSQDSKSQTESVATKNCYEKSDPPGAGNALARGFASHVRNPRSLDYLQPWSVANFAHELQKDFWSLPETAAILCGVDPVFLTVNATILEFDSVALEFKRILDLLYRSTALKRLSDYPGPCSAIDWALERHLQVPSELLSNAASRHLPLRYFPDPVAKYFADCRSALSQASTDLSSRDHLIVEQSSVIELLRKQIAVLGEKLSVLQNSEELAPKERRSLLRMIAGVAYDQYGFRPGVKGDSVSQIVDATVRAGCPLSDDTVRKFVVEAAEHISADALDERQPK